MGAEIRCCIPTLCTGARGTIGARLALLVSSVGRSRQYRAKSLELACNEIEEGARAYIAKIDALGGLFRAIETGFVQQEIQKAAYDYQKAVESGEQVVVGVNRFTAKEEKSLPTLQIDPAIEQEQVARVKAVRARRDNAKINAALAEVERRARETANLMPAILTAVEAYATVGEISDSLRRAFGEYQETVVI